MNHTTARSTRTAVAAHAALADARKLLAHMEHEAALDVDLGPTNWGQAMLDLATTSLDTVDALLADERWPPYSPLPRTWHDLEALAAQGPTTRAAGDVQVGQLDPDTSPRQPLQDARNPGETRQYKASPGWWRGVLMRVRTVARRMQ